jgi:hypothetical protein
VQRARNLDSMNQGLAEQLQRARSDIAQVTLCTLAPSHPRTLAPSHPRTLAPSHPRTLAPSHTHTHFARAFSPITQLVHERNEHAHGRRAADDKVRRPSLPGRRV